MVPGSFVLAILCITLVLSPALDAAPSSGSGAKCDKCNSCKCVKECNCIDAAPSSGSGSKCDKCNSCQCDKECNCIVSVQLVQDTKDNSIGIGWESASGYWYHTGKAMSHVDVYARTMRNGADEQRPVWGDCQLAYNLMRQACINIVDWQCELRWGNCKKNWGSGGDCKWASCIYTTFFAPSVCINGITAGATGGGDKNGPSGSASVSFGLTPIDRVVAGAFGKPTCNAW